MQSTLDTLMNKRFFIIIAIVAVGALMAITVVKTAPKPVKKPIVTLAPLVEAIEFSPSTQRPQWQGGASVNSNKSVNLVSQVSGQIVSVNPLAVPGSFVNKGVELAKIDDANYVFVYEQKKAKVIQAQSSLDMELAQVENAKKDYQRTGMKLNPAGKALALREPQLASAKAALASANSELKKAELDLQRTKLTMPFDGHVLSQNLSEGAFVNNANTVFQVLDANAYWLEVKVPQNFLQVFDQEQPAQLTLLGNKQTRAAQVLTILPQVDAADRQARILISIEDPLLLNETTNGTVAIRYNDYVQVTLFGEKFDGASLIKADSLNKSGNIWVVDSSMQLQNRQVEVLYSGREYSWVNIAGKAGDQILVSQLDNPKIGMALRLSSSKEIQESIKKAKPSIKDIAGMRDANVAELEADRK